MLEGDLSDFTLPDILQLLAYTTKTGRLSLHGSRTVGRVDLDDGQVLDASSDAHHLPLARRLLGAGLVTGESLRDVLDRSSELPTDVELADALAAAGVLDVEVLPELLREQAVDAVFDLLRWDEGSFRFDVHARIQPPTTAPAAQWRAEELLAEAQERLEEWPGISERTGPGTAVVTIARPGRERDVNVTSDGWELLALVDGRRTVDDLISLWGQGEFRTRSVLASLVDVGVIAIGDADVGSVETLVGDHALLAEIEASFADTSPPPVPPPTGPPDAVADAGGEVDESMHVDAEEPPEPWQSDATETDAEEPSDGDDSVDGEAAHDDTGAVTPLRADEDRGKRLRTDPSVDAELIERLIDGVESL